MNLEPNQTPVIVHETNRKVWVVSNLKVPTGGNPSDYIYREDFRGSKIEIPPDREKKVMMPWLMAKRFLGQVTLISDPGPRGDFIGKDGRVDPNKFGKPLEIVELTPEDRQKLEGRSPEEVEKQKKIAEEEEKTRCAICGWQGYTEHGLKIHMGKEHQGHEPLGDSKQESVKIRKSMPNLGGNE